MQNTLYVNLLLTAVITRLACYPQPLLRSFLLNHSLVFQPTVKSLIQVRDGLGLCDPSPVCRPSFSIGQSVLKCQ